MRVYYLTILWVAITALFSQEAKRIEVKDKTLSPNLFDKIPLSSFFIFLSFLGLFLVAGLRWRVGTDYWQYASLYWSYSRVPINELFRLKLSNIGSFGIRTISIISRYTYDDSATMFFLVSLVTIGLCVFHIARTSKTFLYSILLFIFIGSWHGSFNGIRQYMAMAVIFAGSGFIIERKFWKYAIVVFLASLCHTSALVMLPVYFIVRRKVDYKQWFLLVAIGIIMISSYDILFKVSAIILDKQMISTNPYMTKRVNILRVAISWAPLAIYYMVRRVYGKDTESNFYINMLLVNAILRVGTMNSAYLMRIASYTGIFSSLAIPRLLECFDKKSAILLKILILGLYIIFWYIEVSKTPNLYHFKWIFSR